MGARVRVLLRRRPRFYVAVLLTLSCLRLWFTVLTFSGTTLMRESSHLSGESVIALISSEDQQRIKNCEKTWLQQIGNYFVFTKNRNIEVANGNSVRFNYMAGTDWFILRSQSIYADRYFSHHFSWYFFAHDDTYVLVDDLKQELSAFDADEPNYSIIGTYNFDEQPKIIAVEKTKHYLTVASRGAMRILWQRISEDHRGCDMKGNIDTCLSGVSKLSLEQDTHEKYRYFIVNRHFGNFEMSQYTKEHGAYNDGAQVLSRLSESLISLHNLNSDDIEIFDILLNRVRVWPKA
uniref:Glycoprotein-N-acetylgalactosamine 3-beta-galactosyltransferase 1 n=1 Tax=Heterorhabditis bacteriophora TaxID=37862 RepID=A0A1I7W9L8_HETBA